MSLEITLIVNRARVSGIRETRSGAAWPAYTSEAIVSRSSARLKAHRRRASRKRSRRRLKPQYSNRASVTIPLLPNRASASGTTADGIWAMSRSPAKKSGQPPSAWGKTSNSSRSIAGRSP